MLFEPLTTYAKNIEGDNLVDINDKWNEKMCSKKDKRKVSIDEEGSSPPVRRSDRLHK